MRSLAVKRVPDMSHAVRTPDSAMPVLAQRHSTFGPGAVAAPRIVDAGRPLEAAARTDMESGFGRSFENIRVHDDARAHDAARGLGARAYAAGDHVVFGEGAYRPETVQGRALIAHELAHSVQQGGVQMKADGPLPVGADAELETQADRAAVAIVGGRSVSGLSSVQRPALFRAENDPSVGGTTTKPQAGVALKLPSGMDVVKDDPAGIGTTELVVSVTHFQLPLEKGAGSWVKTAYDEAASGGRLVFSPLIQGATVAAYKEGGEDYKDIWLKKYGFTSTNQLSIAFKTSKDEGVKAALTDPGVAKLVNGMGTNLKSSGCDIDHIVEKQMGGTSMASNLQLLTNTTNQASGRETYKELVKLVTAIRDPAMRGPGVKTLQLQIAATDVPPGKSDPSFVVEDLLRKGVVKGSATVNAVGKPVKLTAGGIGETVYVTDTGRTPIDSMAKRIVPGMRLLMYTRGAKGKPDKVEAELDSRAAKKTDAKDSAVELAAEQAAIGASAAPTAGAGAADAPAAPAAVGEARELKLDKSAHKDIAFYYPFLSPGTLSAKSFKLDAQGGFTAEGAIRASVPMLGNLNIRYGNELLELVAPLTKDKLKTPIPGFRFTEGELALALYPSFVPKGSLKFEIGPAAKPVILGDLVAKYEGGAFVATGTLKPAGKVPGISSADGTVEYHSEKGWSGKLEAKSSSIPNTTVDAVLGFHSVSGKFVAYANGGLKTTIKKSTLDMGIAWDGDSVSYSGGVTIEKPLPIVDSVKLKGSYANEVLLLTGEPKISWRGIETKMSVTYRRKDGDPDGKFSGWADIAIPGERASGNFRIEYDEAGNFSGKGSVTYAVTKNIKPTLGLQLKDQKLKASGEVKVGDIELGKKWPSPEGGKLTFIKGVGIKFTIPTPVPLVTVFGRLTASAGLGYGVGPVMLTGISFSGELFPLEEDPKIKAHLKGKLSVPAYGEIYGQFGATIGAEVAAGLVSAEGGIQITPALRVQGEAALAVDAQYESGSFAFSAEAFAKGQMIAKLDIDLIAKLSGGWGLASYDWNYRLKHIEKQIGPELKLTLGKIAYGKNGEITWPSVSQIGVEPKEIDPMEIVKDLVSSSKPKEKE